MMQPPPPRPVAAAAAVAAGPTDATLDSMGDAGAPPPGAAAIVFQCAGCRRAVGDSLALVNADEELRNITLHGACGIVRSPCTRTAEAGKDQGSTYHELFCQGCNAPLGRVYLTTAPALDALRNLFTFDTDALESYELGRYDHALELPEHLKPAATAGAGAEQHQQHQQQQEQQAPEAVQMELTKLQNMMLVFHDRISTLENALKKATSSKGGSGGSGSGGSGGSGSHKKVSSSSSFSLSSSGRKLSGGSSSLLDLAGADENSPPPAGGNSSNKRKKQR